ncbi:hypothetical protein H8D30_01685 [bacterium]|nr:hypothetical protein [bacterium]
MLLMVFHGESWNILGHGLHEMSVGFPVAFAILACLMAAAFPQTGKVVRWTLRWALVAAVAAFVFGINAAGGLGEAWEEVWGEASMGLHALAATLFLVGLVIVVLIGKKESGDAVSKCEKNLLLFLFVIAGATSWLGGEHALHEEGENEGETAQVIPLEMESESDTHEDADDTDDHDSTPHDH